MSNENRNVPELRFPGFEDEWIKMKLDNLGNIFTGSTPDTSKSELYEGKYPFVSPIDIHNNRYVKSTNKTVSKEGFYGGRVIPKGASLFVCIGSTIGKVGQAEIDVTTNQQINALIPYENYDDNYIYTNLYKSSNKIKKLAATQAVPIINKKTFSNFSIYIPKFKEQKKIGDIFSKLDRQIELEEKKLDLLEQQKRGYMQKIFSQGLRFKDEEGNYYKEWDTKQLKDVLEFSNKRTTNENEYPVLTSSRQGLILQSDYYKDGKTFAESNIGYFILPKNYITYRSRSDDGIFKFNLNQIIDVGIISKYYPVFKGINANQYYLTLHLNYQLKKEYIKYATGTSQLVLSQKNLQNIQTKLPSYEEQTKIANFLSELDKLIEKQSDKVELLKDRKKGLLQKMFV